MRCLQGRIVADAMVYQINSAADEDNLVIESDEESITPLLPMLNMYKLRSKVKITLREYQVVSSI